MAEKIEQFNPTNANTPWVDDLGTPTQPMVRFLNFVKGLEARIETLEATVISLQDQIDAKC